MDSQLTNLVVPAAQLEKIEVCLDAIQEDLRATSVLLLDQAGQIIASRSSRGGLEMTAVGALLSGTFYSSRELARALKESEFKSLYQQGPRESIHAELVGEQWILAVVFRKQTLLGMVRVVSKRAVGQLSKILEETKNTNRAEGKWLSADMEEVETSLQNLFKD